MPPAIKRHDKLEWYRRIGLDAFLDPEDDTMKWQPLIVCVLAQLACLTIFLVLSLDVIPNGATQAWQNFGEITPISSCELQRGDKMVRQVFTANSALGYCLVGLMVGMLTFLDYSLALHRARDKTPFCKGPHGNMHVKVTAIANHNTTEHNSGYVSVDPEYLSGSIPCLMRREPVWGVAFSLCLLFLGATTFISHASNRELGARLESTAWFAQIALFSLYALARVIADGTSPRINLCSLCGIDMMDCRVQCDPRKRALTSNLVTWSALGFLLALLVLSALFFQFAQPLVYVTFYSLSVSVLCLCLALHYWGRNEEVDTWYELGLLGLACITLGLVFLHYDVSNSVLCAQPEAYFQAHAVWEALSAAGLGLVYFMFRSDHWMYDLVDAWEERHDAGVGGGMDALESARRVTVMDDIYRASLPNRLSEYSNNSQQQATRRVSSSAAPMVDGRPRTVSNSQQDRLRSADSNARLDMLRAQQQQRRQSSSSRRNQSTSATPIAYWTCPECAFEDNEMSFTSCERCGETRPPLEDFIPVQVG